MGETLRQRFGPLPVWAWALAFVIVLGIYLSMRKNKADAAAAAAANAQTSSTSSNLGTVPVSNLTTAAQPMPIQMGDTFVNTSTPETVNVSPSTTINNQPPSGTLQAAPVPTPSPVIGYGLVNTVQGLMEWLGVNKAGSPVFNVGGGAPVYFGNASALAQGGQYAYQNADIYTPVGYASQVSAGATPINQPYIGPSYNG